MLALFQATTLSWSRVGRSPPDTSLRFTVALRVDATAIEEAFWRVSDPASPDYANHLTAAEVAEISRPKRSAQLAVAEWLRSVAPEAELTPTLAGDFLRCTLTVAQAERLLPGAVYHRWRHPTRGTIVHRTAEVTIPTTMQPHVAFAAPTNSFPSPLVPAQGAALRAMAAASPASPALPASPSPAAGAASLVEAEQRAGNLRTDPPSIRSLYQLGDAQVMIPPSRGSPLLSPLSVSSLLLLSSLLSLSPSHLSFSSPLSTRRAGDRPRHAAGGRLPQQQHLARRPARLLRHLLPGGHGARADDPRAQRAGQPGHRGLARHPVHHEHRLQREHELRAHAGRAAVPGAGRRHRRERAVPRLPAAARRHRRRVAAGRRLGLVRAAWSKGPSWRGHGWPPRAPQTASEGLGAALRTREERPSTSDPSGAPWPSRQRPPESTMPPRLAIPCRYADMEYVVDAPYASRCDVEFQKLALRGVTAWSKWRLGGPMAGLNGLIREEPQHL